MYVIKNFTLPKNNIYHGFHKNLTTALPVNLEKNWNSQFVQKTNETRKKEDSFFKSFVSFLEELVIPKFVFKIY